MYIILGWKHKANRQGRFFFSKSKQWAVTRFKNQSQKLKYNTLHVYKIYVLLLIKSNLF